MKAFLQHDVTGMFYQGDDRWVKSPAEARAFATEQDAAKFRDAAHAEPSHPVKRLDPMLLVRLATRAPGVYQVGE
jgi:hypothetical protein